MMGDRIRMAREFAGFTQTELAEKIGIKQQSLQAVESGETLMPRKLNKYAEVLGVNLNWILTGEGLMKSNKDDVDGFIFSKLGQLTSIQKNKALKFIDELVIENQIMFKEIGGIMMANNYEQGRHA